MNRRDFFKKAGVGALATWTVTCKYEEQDHNQTDPKGHEGETGAVGRDWDYRVYCYEREQGEWVFSENIRGSFAPEREYMTFEEEKYMPYAGWMDQGKLHFTSLEEAQDFVDMHVKAKDDINLVDSIYDIYYINKEGVEIKVAHYWFNGDTGRQIEWVADKPYTDFTKVECA